MRRKLVNVYVVTIFILFIGIAILMAIGWTGVAIGFSIAGIFFTILMAIPMGEIKWHLSYEDMEKDQRESIRSIRNATKLIDQTKRELFRQSIMTKEEVMKIVDRTYEETLKDKKL